MSVQVKVISATYQITVFQYLDFTKFMKMAQTVIELMFLPNLLSNLLWFIWHKTHNQVSKYSGNPSNKMEVIITANGWGLNLKWNEIDIKTTTFEIL